MKLESYTKEELIKMIYDMGYIEEDDTINYEEEILQAEINQYDDKLVSIDYVDYGYGIGCYGAL